MACIEGVDEARLGEGFDAPGAAFQVFRLGWLFGVEIIEVSQVAGADESVVCMGDGVFQHAVEFADITWPHVVTEQFHGFARDARHSEMMDGTNV